MKLTDPQQLLHLDRGNRFIGQLPTMEDSELLFYGEGNLLVCPEPVKLQGCKIKFHGDRSLVYLCPNRHKYRLNIGLFHDCVFYMGRDNFMSGAVNGVLSEGRHVVMGRGGLISFDVWLRTTDTHLVYSAKTMERTNAARSIYIGDHVWLGQSAMVLKGSRIDSGSIVGAMSLVAGKHIPHNQSWGGNPAKKIGEDIFWDGSATHYWQEEEFQRSQSFHGHAQWKGIEPDAHLFAHDPSQRVDYDWLEAQLTGPDPAGKLPVLDRLSANEAKNRFVQL